MSLYGFIDEEKYDPNRWVDLNEDETTDITISKKKLKKNKKVSYMDDDTDIWF
jgi:hypothetical protein